MQKTYECKEINGYENYLISTNGDVYNKKTGRKMKTRITKTGYVDVSICNEKGAKTFLIHRLVAMTHIDNVFNKPFVNHKDHDRKNNNVSNLEWVTAEENSNHMFRKKKKGTISKTKIIDIYESKKWENVEDFYKEIIDKY